MKRHAPQSLRIMTYNIRQCLGMDGERSPDRILRILRDAGADVVALQEVSDPAGQAEDHAPLGFFSRQTGMSGVAAPTLGHGPTAYGNVLLSRWPLREAQTVDLSVPGREPRNAIRAVLDTPAGPVRVIATHLGLSIGERRIQMNALATLVAEDVETPTVLLGDLNEWRWGAAGIRKMSRLLQVSGLPRTFPSRWPVFPLDQIWTRHGGCRTCVLRTAEARIASDHLPVMAEVAIPGR